MEQEPKKITDRQIYETSIGPVCMSKIEYAMYQEEMVKRIGKLHIYVDADACPVVRIVEKIAEKYTIPVTLLCDTNHVLQSNYSEVIVVGAGADAVDYKLISICHKGDIVVSQDYGVAAMALGKGAYAIHQSGKWYTNDNIDRMLMERHLNKKARRSSGKNHIKGNNRNHQGAEKQTVFLSAAATVPKNEIREHLRCPLPVAPSPSGCARRTPAGFRLHAEAHERSRRPG